MIYLRVKDERFRKFNSDVVDCIMSLDGVMLAGGCFRSWINGDEVIQDYDLFFTTLYAHKPVENFFVDKGWNVVFRCPLGELVTLKNGDEKVQLITKFTYTSVAQAIDTFDLTACCVGYDAGLEQLVCHPDWVRHVKKKQIDFHRVMYPVATISRIIKYSQKGYRYSQTSLAKYVQIVNESEYDENNLVLYVD